jgi:hypothetical protein
MPNGKQQRAFPLRTQANFRISIVYRGPDKKYFGRDICYGYNEDTLTIYDVVSSLYQLLLLHHSNLFDRPTRMAPTPAKSSRAPPTLEPRTPTR